MLRATAAAVLLLNAPADAQPGVPYTPAPPVPGPAVPDYSKLAVPNAERFAKYLELNRAPASGMPLSYNPPAGYFSEVPPGLKRTNNDPNGTFVYVCKGSKMSMPGKPDGTLNSSLMNNYEFETEQILATLGNDIYDGSVWTIAQTILGRTDEAQYYTKYVLWAARTFQLGNLRGSGAQTGDDGLCKGIEYTNSCADPDQSGGCGLCYGDGPTTIKRKNALMFRLIADQYAVDQTKDARCPDLPREFTWNDFKPIVGENAWAMFLGPLTLALKVYGSPDKIPEDSPEFQLGYSIIPALQALRVSATGVGKGAIYYTPHNAFFYKGSTNINAGSTVSVENQASLLAGLKAFGWVLSYKPKYEKTLCEVNDMISGLEEFLFSAWNGEFFRQGGTYDKQADNWSWGTANQPDFAVDCQTWVTTVLGPKKIDQQFGANTSYNLWQTLKAKSGYGTFVNNSVKGTGYSLRPDYVGFPSTDTREVSPVITVAITDPYDSFNESAWLDRVAYVLGVPPASAKILNYTTASVGTRVALVFTRIGFKTARQTAVDFVNLCNTPGTDSYRYAHCFNAAVEEIFSGEWTLGAINYLRVVVANSGYPDHMLDELVNEADFMRMYVDEELLSMERVRTSYDQHAGILYGSARYYVPFGWWSNPIQATSSTGWAVFVDSSWNPLMITGDYGVDYPSSPAANCSGILPNPPESHDLPDPASLPFPPTPHEILNLLYKDTMGPEWYVTANWLDPFTYDPCGNASGEGATHPYGGSWNGIVCDNDGRIVQLNLANNRLIGTLPDSIGELTYLTKIDMRENTLSGQIPDLSKLTRLESLQLSQNQLTGGVPAWLGQLPRLKLLWLTDNQLSGTVPDSFADAVSHLQVLNINNNKLVALPNVTVDYSKVFNCDFSGNPFSCPVPKNATTYCYAYCY